MRTVLITGASSDIGLATTRRYLSGGWRVIAHFRTPRAALNDLVGPMLETWQADFSDIKGFDRALRQQSNLLINADAFVNLAAAMPVCSFGDATAEMILSTLMANTIPGLLIMQLLGPAMAQRRWGRIVHASSIGVKFGGGSESFLYSLSKHALEFIPVEARRWASDDVFVNVLRVGVTDTRAHVGFVRKDLPDRVSKIPAKRMAQPVEVAEALYWLGSDANGFMTGQVIDVAGGE